MVRQVLEGKEWWSEAVMQYLCVHMYYFCFLLAKL